MCYKITKATVGSSDGESNFIIVAEVLKGDTLALYKFITCLNYLLQTLLDLIKENRFECK